MGRKLAGAQNSTTVRSNKGRGLRALRASLAAVETLAPGLALRVAERLFLTPPRHPVPDRERAALAGAEPFALAVAGTTLRGARIGDGPAVVLVHGWGGRGAQLAAFAPPLLAAGCSVVAFDGPAHGASAGRTASLPGLADSAAAVARRFGARAAIGHSLGGAALALALHRGLALDAAVLVAPPAGPGGFFAAFCDALGLGDGMRSGLRRRIERRVGVAMDALNLPRLAAGLSTPALVIHDRSDDEVPFEDGAALAGAWPGARLIGTEGLGHRRILRDGAAAREAAEFVVERLARCGCGRLAVTSAGGEPRCASCLLALHLADRERRAPDGGALRAAV